MLLLLVLIFPLVDGFWWKHYPIYENFDYNIDMKLSNKLTEHAELRFQLLELVDRINIKVRKITLTHQKLPFERLIKGRALKQLAIDAIECIDQGKEIQLRECIQQLRAKGLLKL